MVDNLWITMVHMLEVFQIRSEGNRWGYLEILDLVKQMVCLDVVEMWYDFAGQLKLIKSDFGVYIND